ncbi:hypothetical protein DVB69_15455 [Sporosarcina sp. BI001-red]|nr:hypothetical protein DVB69_15455 [Sporosarcina sp. BI001-red]
MASQDFTVLWRRKDKRLSSIDCVIVKYFLKTRDPNVDDTDRMRDLTFEMYERVKRNPEYYIEGVEES